MAKPTTTETPFTIEVPRLLAERGMSISALARAVGVSQPYMSRVIRAKNYKSAAAGDLLRRVANALDLPDDYFAEARQKYLMDRIASDPKLRDELYQRVRRADEKANR